MLLGEFASSLPALNISLSPTEETHAWAESNETFSILVDVIYCQRDDSHVKANFDSLLAKSKCDGLGDLRGQDCCLGGCFRLVSDLPY